MLFVLHIYYRRPVVPRLQKFRSQASDQDRGPARTARTEPAAPAEKPKTWAGSQQLQPWQLQQPGPGSQEPEAEPRKQQGARQKDSAFRN